MWMTINIKRNEAIDKIVNYTVNVILKSKNAEDSLDNIIRNGLRAYEEYTDDEIALEFWNLFVEDAPEFEDVDRVNITHIK